MKLKKVRPSSDVSTLLKDTSVIALSRFFVMFYNLTLIFFLSKEDYGQLAYYDYIAQFCLSISSFGLTSVLIKDLHTKNNGEVLTNFLILKVFGILIVNSTWHLYLAWDNKAQFNFILMNYIYTFFLCLLWDWYFIGTNRTFLLVRYYIINVLILIVGTITLYFYTMLTAFSIRSLQLLSVIIALLAVCGSFVKEIKVSYFDLAYIKSVLRQGVFILGVQAMQSSVLTITTSVIKSNFGFAGLAPFSVALRLCQIVVSFRNMAIGPLTKFLMRKGPLYYSQVINLHIRLVLMLFLILMVPFYLWGEGLIVFLWHDNRIWVVLLILSFIPLWNIMFIYDGVVININKKQKMYFYSTSIAFVIFLVFTIYRSESIYYYAFVYLLFESVYAFCNHFFIARKL